MAQKELEKIERELKKIQKELNEQQERIATVEQKLSNPTYEYRSSLATLTGNYTKKYKKYFKRDHSLTSFIICVVSVLFFYYIAKFAWKMPYCIGLLAFYSLALFCGGLYCKWPLLRCISYWFSAMALSEAFLAYKYHQLLHPYYRWHLNGFLSSFVLLFLIYYIFSFYYKKRLSYYEQKWLSYISGVLLMLCVYMWGAANIILIFDKTKGGGSFFIKRFSAYSPKDALLVRTKLTEIILISYTLIVAAISTWIASWRKNNLLYGFAGLLLLFAGGKLWYLFKNF